MKGPSKYVGMYNDWKCIVTNKNRALPIEKLEGSLPFPRRLVPVVGHELVRNGSPDVYFKLLTRHLMSYLDFTEELEHKVVNQVTYNIGRRTTGFTLPEEMADDAWKIYIEEAIHAKSSDDLLRAIQLSSGVLFQTPPTHPFLVSLGRIMDENPGYEQLIMLFFSIVSETMISGILSDIPRDKSVQSNVREVIREHSIDEGRHHKYFSQLLNFVWPQLSEEQMDVIGPLFPFFILDFLRPNLENVRRDLEYVGFSESKSTQIVEDSYSEFDFIGNAKKVSRHTLRYLRDADVFRSQIVVDAFGEKGLL